MSFVKVNPGGFAVGATLTSSQMNALDADHANAVDKTVAGDTLAGALTMGASAQLLAGFASNIVGFADESIKGTSIGAIASMVNGAIGLHGGPDDYPSFIARSRIVFAPPSPLGPLAAGWTGGVNLGGPATNSQIVLLLPVLHNGATLSTVFVSMQVLGTHSALPANPPSLRVLRLSITPAAPGVPQDLSTTPIQQMPTSTPAAYDAGNLVQTWSYNANQNNVIDTFGFMYYVILHDEFGANSVANNQYFGFLLSYTAISDMRFP